MMNSQGQLVYEGPAQSMSAVQGQYDQGHSDCTAHTVIFYNPKIEIIICQEASFV